LALTEKTVLVHLPVDVDRSLIVRVVHYFREYTGKVEITSQHADGSTINWDSAESFLAFPNPDIRAIEMISLTGSGPNQEYAKLSLGHSGVISYRGTNVGQVLARGKDDDVEIFTKRILELLDSARSSYASAWPFWIMASLSFVPLDLAMRYLMPGVQFQIGFGQKRATALAQVRGVLLNLIFFILLGGAVAGALGNYLFAWLRR